MFLAPLLMAAALSTGPTLRETPAAPSSQAAVLVDCQVSGQALTDCQAVEGEPFDPTQVAEAERLASQIEVPEAVALANPGRIRVRMTVNR